MPTEKRSKVEMTAWPVRGLSAPGCLDGGRDGREGKMGDGEMSENARMGTIVARGRRGMH